MIQTKKHKIGIAHTCIGFDTFSNLVLFLAKRERERLVPHRMSPAFRQAVNGLLFLQPCSICQSVLWATGPGPAITPAHVAVPSRVA